MRRVPSHLSWSITPLIEMPESNLTQDMGSLKWFYTHNLNRHPHRFGHVLLGRFKSIVVEREPYLLELRRYLAFHPVRSDGAVTQTAIKSRCSPHLSGI